MEDGMLRGPKTLLIGVAFASVFSSSAAANGFSRGTADTDILFEEGNFVMRAGALYVAPQRGYGTIGGVASTDGNYTDSYTIPSAAVKLDLYDKLSCAGTVTQPFGAGATYGTAAILAGALSDGTGTVKEGFTTTEFGLTCGVHFDAGKGNLWLIGGGFLENFDYSQTVQVATLGFTEATLTFHDQYRPGYRLGVAYEIPEIAFRAQLMYRSGVNHTPDGSQGSFSTEFFGTSDPVNGNGTLPQSVEFKLQSGIAPEWLAFGSVKWTDWSSLDTLDYTIQSGAFANDYVLEYYWRDSWTVSGGIGHAFNDMVSGSVSLTWDQGVSTTEDAHFDNWTLATGISVKQDNAEFRLGGAVTYLAGGSVAADPTPTTPGLGNSFAYTVNGDWSYAIGANFKVSF